MTKFKFTLAVLAFASLSCTAHAQLPMPMVVSLKTPNFIQSYENLCMD